MAGLDRRELLFWLATLTAVLGLKHLYSLADMSQLQWLLQPLAMLLGVVGGFDFRLQPSGAWLDAEHGLVIVKACAGGNFLLASWLGYQWRFRHNGKTTLRRVLQAVAAAWLSTLLANALRILCIAHGQYAVARTLQLSAADSHRLIGIAVYFGCLCLQMVNRRALLPGILAASLLYLGITLLLPAARAWLLGLPSIDTRHALWLVALPAAALLLAAIWHGLYKTQHKTPPKPLRETPA